MEQPQYLGSARVVLWDPSGSNRFVVGGGNELKMYEWNHEVRVFYPFDHVSKLLKTS
jgi:hypothetical protein